MMNRISRRGLLRLVLVTSLSFLTLILVSFAVISHREVSSQPRQDDVSSLGN